MQKKQKPKKRAFVYASQRTIMIASVDAMHTRAESAEGKGGTMVGAKEIASWAKNNRDTQRKHAAANAA